MRGKENIMFDFDGTLADTSEGIIKSMHYAYDKLGIPHEEDHHIRNIIGPPLEEMFTILLNTQDKEYIRQAVHYFRERYATNGVRELSLYPMVRDVLEELHQREKKLYIVTSKPEKFVLEICEEQRILSFFSGITGVSAQKSSLSKAERMKHLMREKEIDGDSCIMVGDRVEDVIAAKSNGVSCIGVSYGFGKKNDLEEGGCLKVINNLEELLEY